MKKRISAAIALLLLLSALLPLPAAAAKSYTPITEPKGSITVRVRDGEKALKDLKLTCIQVGELAEINGKPEFVRIYDGKILTGDILKPELAQEIYQYGKDNSSNTDISTFERLEVRVDKDGYAIFSNRNPGLYLIVQETAYSGYEPIAPFLVTIPYNGDYHVDAINKPKLEIDEDPTTETTKPKEKLPQTGQLNWPVPALASGGMLLFALGWLLRKDDEKDEYEA